MCAPHNAEAVAYIRACVSSQHRDPGLRKRVGVVNHVLVPDACCMQTVRITDNTAPAHNSRRIMLLRKGSATPCTPYIMVLGRTACRVLGLDCCCVCMCGGTSGRNLTSGASGVP
ncbi:hypothetical protein HaLaN_08971 [Haematococcus lacustris]|uniref:Uncharacterized protein n=1 Tax=Haematococcus lacustris TaxID=44745 RepID=A0A699Z2C1_HAELA|nr:hypothetical protein HaLaN_08971 [Haematococcus lacustris]